MDLDLYDSEKMEIRKICERVVEDRRDSLTTKKAIATELLERLYDAGFETQVVMKPAVNRQNGEMRFVPEVTVLARVNPEAEHDHERHGHEVRANIIGAAQPEVATAKPVAMPGRLWTPNGSTS